MKTLYYIFIALALLVLGAVADLSVYAVSGPSMEPAYKDSERVLADKYLWRVLGLGAGDVVVFDHPAGRATLDIKRVSDTPSERGTYFLLGDNARNSQDSREFGSIPKDYIRARVIMKL